jgi:HK97 family phage portal protein
VSTIFGRVREQVRNANPLENPEIPISSPAILEALGIQPNSSGKLVNETTALGLPAYWRGMQVTCNVPAALPLHAYVQDGAQRVRAEGQPADLVDDPHPDMTPLELWQTVYAHKRGWGNAYLRKLKDPLGRVRELWPIHPSRVRVGRESEAGRKIYVIDGHTDDPMYDDQILHLPGIGYDGICGVSPVRAARESIGLGLAAQEFGAKLFGSGALAAGILQTEQRLTQKQADALHARWKAKHSGLGNAHEVIVMDKGAKFEQLTIPPEDAQFLQSRRFQVTEICRMFGIPPFLMFETETSTSWGTGLEQQALSWVKIDLLPELAAVEQRLTKHVLRPGPVYAHYSVDGLLRGDAAARAAFYKALWSIGVFNTDEIRGYEDLGPVPGGQTRYRPLNMGELGTTDSGSGGAPSETSSGSPADLSREFAAEFWAQSLAPVPQLEESRHA